MRALRIKRSVQQEAATGHESLTGTLLTFPNTPFEQTPCNDEFLSQVARGMLQRCVKGRLELSSALLATKATGSRTRRGQMAIPEKLLAVCSANGLESTVNATPLEATRCVNTRKPFRPKGGPLVLTPANPCRNWETLPFAWGGP